jgi:hypothetical protein
MWPQLIAVIAGAMMDKQKEELARQQATSQMYMQYAQSLNPKLNMAPYQAQQLNRQMDEQRGQSAQHLLASLGSSLISDAPSMKGGSAPQLSAPSLVSGDYGPGYGYGAPSSFAYPGSDFQLQTPRLLR